MTWQLVVAGTCHIDDIETPSGRRPAVQGGSAVYFALAATAHVPVLLLSVVGSDAEQSVRATLAGSPVDLSRLAVSPLPTYRWTVRHDLDSGIALDGETPPQHSAGDDWSPRLDELAAGAPVFFAASLDPRLQREVIAQSRARLLAADTMTTHITTGRDDVAAVVESVDLLFVNHHELSVLLPGPARPWSEAARLLCGRGRLRAVVVKRGALGAACVSSDRLIEKPAHPTVVIDPTGAGDALAGGFLGACAAAERDDADFFEPALDAGLRAAALAVAGFGTTGLRTSAATQARLPGP